MHILWLGKRFYTGKDALREQFGRMYRVPRYWQKSGQRVRLWLVDHHTRETVRLDDGGMEVVTAPLISIESMRQIWRVLMAKRPNCIVASGDCYIGLLGWLLAKLTGAIFVFDVYDKYDEFSAYRRPFGFDLFAYLLARADGLMFASHGLAAKLGNPLSMPITVVPNGVDETLFSPKNLAMSRRELGLAENAQLVGYFGAMAPDRGVADLLAAVGLIRDRGVLIQVVLAGVADSSLSLNQTWIHYLGMLPHKRIPALLNACNVVVVPYRLSPFMDMGASCKIAEYLACRRPLVATRTPNFLTNFSEQAAVMGEALCLAANPDDMARALTHQFDAQVVPPMAKNMNWETIAYRALEWLSEIHANEAPKKKAFPEKTGEPYE